MLGTALLYAATRVLCNAPVLTCYVLRVCYYGMVRQVTFYQKLEDQMAAVECEDIQMQQVLRGEDPPNTAMSSPFASGANERTCTRACRRVCTRVQSLCLSLSVSLCFSRLSLSLSLSLCRTRAHLAERAYGPTPIPGTERVYGPTPIPGTERVYGPTTIPGTERVYGPTIIPGTERVYGPTSLAAPQGPPAPSHDR
eukprot:3934832-Rhodomonas_salina.4